MSRIKSRLSAYRDYLRPLVMEGKPMSLEDVLVMIQQLQDDLKKDERPKLTKIEKCFVESLNDKWDYLCRNSNGELEAVKRTFTLFAVNSESLNLKDVTKAKFDFIADDGRRWLISELKEFEVEV